MAANDAFDGFIQYVSPDFFTKRGSITKGDSVLRGDSSSMTADMFNISREDNFPGMSKKGTRFGTEFKTSCRIEVVSRTEIPCNPYGRNIHFTREMTIFEQRAPSASGPARCDPGLNLRIRAGITPGRRRDYRRILPGSRDSLFVS